jgi:hypothetical protein
MVNYIEERSPLWNWAAGAALVAGAAGTYLSSELGLKTARNLNAGAQMRAVAEQAARAASFRSPTGAGAVSTEISDLTEHLLSKGSFQPGRAGYSAFRSNMYEITYRAIMAGRRTSHEKAMEAIQGLVGMPGTTSGRDFVSKVYSTLKATGGSQELVGRELGPMLSGEGYQGLKTRGGVRPGMVSATDIWGSAPDSIISSNPRAEEYKRILNEAAGGKLKISWSQKYASDTIGGQKRQIPMLIGRIGGSGQNLHIPLEDVGYTYSGENLTSRYALRKIHTPSGKLIPYSDAYVNRMAETIASAPIAELEERMSREAVALHGKAFIDESVAKAGIWQLPENMMTSGGLAKARLAQLESAPFSKMTDEGIESLIKSGSLHPYVSPGAAGAGVLSTIDLPQQIYGDWGRFMTPEQRPGQFIRGEMGATLESKLVANYSRPFAGTFGQFYNRIEDKFVGEGYNDLILGGKAAASREAYTAPKYMTAYALTNKEGFRASQLESIMALEEGYVKPSAASMFEVERTSSKLIALDDPFFINQKIKSAIEGTTIGGSPVSVNLGVGEYEIGTEKGTGKQLSTGIDSANRKTTVSGARLVDEKTAEVFFNEKIRLHKDEAMKFYGPDVKNIMAVPGSESEYVSHLQKAGAVARFGNQPVEALVGGGTLQKSTGAILMQQTEALSAVLGSKVDARGGKRGTGRKKTRVIKEFLSDPVGFLGKGRSDYEIQKRLFQLAKAQRVSSELPNIFGATDEATLSRLASEGVITEAERQSISKATVVYGMGKGRIGGLGTDGGVLRRGSFEQSGFALMAAKGPAERKLVGDIAARLNRIDSISELDRMLGSLTGGSIISPKDSDELAKLTINNILSPEGRHINLGRSFSSLGGSRYMYMPGTDAVPGLADTITETGEAVRNPIVKKLNLLRDVIEKKLPEEEIEKAAEALRNAVGRHTEAAAAGRGEVIGSVNLRARKGIQKSLAADLRMSKEGISSMYDDLIESAVETKTKEFLLADKQRALRGEVFDVLAWRHPTTGPYSSNITSAILDPELAAGDIAFNNREGSLLLNGSNKIRKIDISTQTGFKVDMDGDTVVVAAINNRDQVARAAKRPAISDDYARYLITHTELKDKMGQARASTLADLSDFKRVRLSGIKKLRAPATTGVMNIAMQKAKLGLLANNPDAMKDLAPLLFHLEEASIGGKHGLIGKQILQQFSEGLEEGGESGIGKITSAIKSVFGDARDISGELKVGEETFSHTIKFDPEANARTLVEAYHASKADVDLSIKQRAYAKGKTYIDVSLDELRRMQALRQRGSVDVGQAAVQQVAEGGGLYKTTASNAVAVATKAKAAGRALWEAKWPLLAGAAVAGGLMLLAPSGAGQVPYTAPPRKEFKEDSVDIPNGGGISIPPSRMNNSPTVYDMGMASTNSTLQMSSADLGRSNRGFSNSVNGLAGGGRGRITVRDDRSALDPNQLANHIYERL